MFTILTVYLTTIIVVLILTFATAFLIKSIAKKNLQP